MFETLPDSGVEDGSAQVAVSGVWLSEFGFEFGSKVVIDVSDGQIIVKPVGKKKRIRK